MVYGACTCLVWLYLCMQERDWWLMTSQQPVLASGEMGMETAGLSRPPPLWSASCKGLQQLVNVTEGQDGSGGQGYCCPFGISQAALHGAANLCVWITKRVIARFKTGDHSTLEWKLYPNSLAQCAHTQCVKIDATVAIAIANREGLTN